MKLNDIINDKTRLTIVVVSVLIIIFPIGYSIVAFAVSPGADASGPFIEKPDEKKHEECIEDARFMRFKHMDLLKEVRDQVMREGKKAEIVIDGKNVEVGIQKCRECHAGRKQFCDKCHNAVNLKLDCFGCHYFPEMPE